MKTPARSGNIRLPEKPTVAAVTYSYFTGWCSAAVVLIAITGRGKILNNPGLQNLS
jgi:hypothetical protein